MKRPSFQFYPGDWLQDAALRSVSVGARGLWIDMICLMHQGSDYGFLKVNHKVILTPNLARILGATLPEVEGWLDELKQAGVYAVDESGAIFSKRMIRDEKLRLQRAEGGKLGGNPALMAKNKVNLPPNLLPTPSSSSSSSFSLESPLPPNGKNGHRRLKATDSAPCPDTEAARRICKIIGRRAGTKWTGAEVMKFKQLEPFDDQDLTLLEKFYGKGQNDPDAWLRQSISVLLNNYPGELDKARAYFRKKSQEDKP